MKKNIKMMVDIGNCVMENDNLNDILKAAVKIVISLLVLRSASFIHNT